MTNSGTAYGTDFTETEALLAVQSDDPQTLARLITDMHPNELRELAWTATTLSDVLWDAAGRPTEGWLDRTANRGFRARCEAERAGA